VRKLGDPHKFVVVHSTLSIARLSQHLLLLFLGLGHPNMFVQCVPFKVVVLKLCDMKSDEEMAMLTNLTLSLFISNMFIFIG
jgi:hypothetical protein